MVSSTTGATRSMKVIAKRMTLTFSLGLAIGHAPILNNVCWRRAVNSRAEPKMYDAWWLKGVASIAVSQIACAIESNALFLGHILNYSLVRANQTGTVGAIKPACLTLE